MPPDVPLGSPDDWLARARGKLSVARFPLPDDGFWEDLCYMAQQAAELGLKAVYQAHGWRFPFVHNLGLLLDGLLRQGVPIPESVQKADLLSIYATQMRYPGMSGLVGKPDYDKAVEIAAVVVEWAESQVTGEPPVSNPPYAP